MPESLNELERKVLDYIVGYLRSNTYQPSIREIGREFSIKSTKTVSELLQSLADKGWIERDPSRSRGVRVLGLEAHPGGRSVPVVGADLVPGAGYFEVDRRLGGATGCFLMAVAGDHLRQNGILAGDLLLVEPVAMADLQPGDVAVLQLAGGAVVRSVASVTGGIVLAAADGAGMELTWEQARVSLRGRAAGVIRRFTLRAPEGAALSPVPAAPTLPD
jgi:repressor LexA